eukprot:g72784.t1
MERALAPPEVEPRPGEECLRTEDIAAAIKLHGASLAVVLFGAVQFYTGQAFEIKTITALGHAQGAYVGFDCAHAVGNIELQLHDWQVDFATWCSYKYLNGGAGAGSISGIFLHHKHNNKSFEELPRFLGWWGQEVSQRFAMEAEHKWKRGARSYMLSNPGMLVTVALETALELHVEASMPRLRHKSLRLTRYLELLLDKQIFSKNGARLITPRDPQQRGAQLSLRFDLPSVKSLNEKLLRKGVV